MFTKIFASVLLVSSSLSFAQQSTAPIPSAVLPTPTPGQVVATKPKVIPAAPQLAATGFILVDATTGNIIAEHNSEERLPPASLTKMMSSYLVVDEIEKGRITAWLR